MSVPTIEEVTEVIYQSLETGNDNIDMHITNLKAALNAAGEKEAVFEPERLSQNNRQGRKMMQSYFKKRGVRVVFKASK